MRTYRSRVNNNGLKPWKLSSSQNSGYLSSGSNPLLRNLGGTLLLLSLTAGVLQRLIVAKSCNDIEKNEERKLEEQERRKLEHSARAPTLRHGASCLGVQSSSPGFSHPPTPRRPKSSSGPSHPRLGVDRVLKAHA
ncbi:hypothetical protein PIB30_074444 [Stylosanthes scabra]|uniref:Uncharacterized protein n=1 Tax=Stylosanthes scabra TaxID=79078 RepID=A0ABU6YQF8_9FABA|nr:hypothetical protein [Stylosanthes scabra]